MLVYKLTTKRWSDFDQGYDIGKQAVTSISELVGLLKNVMYLKELEIEVTTERTDE